MQTENSRKEWIGKACKLLIENINTKVRELSSVNQWQDSGHGDKLVQKYQEQK